MQDILKNNDLIITNNKKSILKKLSGKLLNVKIMSKNEFINSYFGYYNEEAIYYLINKYNYKYSIAKMHLDNFLFDDIKDELITNNLIITEPLFRNSIKRIVIDCDIDPYLKKEIEKYDHIFLNNTRTTYFPTIYEFDDMESEVNFVALKIIELLKNININNIFLLNVDESYEMIIKRIFNLYNIPINLNIKRKIIGNNIVKNFINTLKTTKSLECINDLPNNEISNIIINVVNNYNFKELDDTIIYCIEEELKTKTLNNVKYQNAINITDINDISDDNYYFLLGFNQGSIPKIYKDEDYLSDVKKRELGILTSLEKNILEHNKVKELITSNENITISYKLSSYKDIYYKSSLINELNLNIERPDLNTYNYSNLYNKLSLSKKIDKLIKYNEYDNDLGILYSNYKGIDYLCYNNTYNKIDSNLFKNYINNNILLSYSSIDNYYRCGFKYYLTNILKLDKYEENFMAYIGTLFHYILSIAFKDNFDFDYEYSNYIKEKELSAKEKFFINKLKSDLLFTIETIKKHNEYSNLTNELYEQKIYVNKDRNIKITFMGVIDKLKYIEGNETIVAIIDYKTGNTDIDLNNMIYGIGMQLPIYLYLSKHSKLENVKIAGFYLQKIIHNKLNYENGKDYDYEKSKLYRLDGYSNSDTNILKEFDSSYDNSNVIRSMKTTSKGYYAYAKVLSNNQIDKINDIVDAKIDEAINNILDTKFDINPKKIGDELVGCEYCKFKDICYKKEEDVVNFKKQNYKDFLGGDENA